MRPYFKHGNITLYHGKVEELLHQNISTDDAIVISDPPYNVGYHYDDCEDDMNEDSYYRFMASVFSDSSVVIHYPESMFRLAQAMKRIPDRIVPWVYPSNTPRQSRLVAWFDCKPDFRKDGQEYRNPNDPRIAKRIAEGKRARLYDWWQVNQVKNVSREKTAHPCQIPVEIMERIIRITSPKKVVEPFAGSGTTMLAAMRLGVECVGIEMSEKYCEIIATRLTEAAKEGNQP